MKVLLINGSPNKDGCVNRALNEIKSELEKQGVNGEVIWLGTTPMQDCVACAKCQTTGKCVFNDIVNEVSSKLDDADGIVIGSPVYYGGPNGRITSFMDRLCFSAGSKLDGMVAASVVSCRRAGATAAYERLNMYFGMTNCIVPASQYWNVVHGFSADDVEKDLEGLQTLRTLADNIVWTIKAQKTASENGVQKPKRETITFTHFMDGKN